MGTESPRQQCVSDGGGELQITECPLVESHVEQRWLGPRTLPMLNHCLGDCLGKHGLRSKAGMGPKSTAAPGYLIIAAEWPVLLEEGPMWHISMAALHVHVHMSINERTGAGTWYPDFWSSVLSSLP